MTNEMRQLTTIIKENDNALNGGNDLRKRYFAPNIPERIFEKLVRYYDRYLKREDIIAFYDSSLPGNSKAGIIFTNEGFYYKYITDAKFFRYTDIYEMYVEKQNMKLFFKDAGREACVIVDVYDMNVLRKILLELKEQKEMLKEVEENVGEPEECNLKISIEIEKPQYQEIIQMVKEMDILGQEGDLLVDLVELIPNDAKDKIVERVFRDTKFRQWLTQSINAQIMDGGKRLCVDDICVKEIGKESVKILVEIGDCNYFNIKQFVIDRLDISMNNPWVLKSSNLLDVVFGAMLEEGVNMELLNRILTKCNKEICSFLSDLLADKINFRIVIKSILIEVM